MLVLDEVSTRGGDCPRDGALASRSCAGGDTGACAGQSGHIQSLTHGVYQLKQAIPYTKQHIVKEGNFLFELYEEEINILHVKIRSRYSNQLTHNLLTYQKQN